MERVVCRSTINEEPFSHKCSREVLPNDKNKETIGKKQNTRLMRFGKLPTSSRQGRESALLIQ